MDWLKHWSFDNIKFVRLEIESNFQWIEKYLRIRNFDQNNQFVLKLIIWSIISKSSYNGFFRSKATIMIGFFLYRKLRSRYASAGQRDWTNWAQLRDKKNDNKKRRSNTATTMCTVRTMNTRLEQTKPTAVTVRKLFTENHNKNIKRLLVMMLYSECEILKEEERKMNEAANW